LLRGPGRAIANGVKRLKNLGVRLLAKTRFNGFRIRITGRRFVLEGKINPWVVIARGVWAMKPFARGRAVEQVLGTNLPGNFPAIDRFLQGTATSIKSLDLAAKTYQDTRALTRTVTRYIDGVAKFQGRMWGGATVRGADIKARVLDAGNSVRQRFGRAKSSSAERCAVRTKRWCQSSGNLTLRIQ
jgi:hypothetical protein